MHVVRAYAPGRRRTILPSVPPPMSCRCNALVVHRLILNCKAFSISSRSPCPATSCGLSELDKLWEYVRQQYDATPTLSGCINGSCQSCRMNAFVTANRPDFSLGLPGCGEMSALTGDARHCSINYGATTVPHASTIGLRSTTLRNSSTVIPATDTVFNRNARPLVQIAALCSAARF